MDEMEAIIKEFLVESNENLDQLDRDVVELEKNPHAPELLAGIFRTIHSIKGATGFLGFSKLGEVAHCGESLLSRLRDGSLTLNPEITSGLLALVDAIRKLLSEIAEQGREGDANYSALTDRLTSLQQKTHGTQDALDTVAIPIRNASAVRPDKTEAGIPSSPSEIVSQGVSRPAPDAHEKSMSAVDPDVAATATTTTMTVEADRPAKPGAALPQEKEFVSRPSSLGSLRVEVEQLDKLMNLVGELVLVRNQILQICSREQEPKLIATSQQLNLLTSELQEGVVKVRMQPIDNIWQQFPRMVRDLAMQCGKRVLLEMQGKETELDKAVIEAIKDPLTHVVRNAIDHGIERPEVRAANGKAPQGRLWLRAFHENGQVNIEISDDGAGIDLARLRQTAVEGGLITPDQGRLLDESQSMALLFLPGFSTAKEVTNISGRGVGMDVVKTNVEKIGGTVEIQSRLGRGTTTIIRIPLTLSIMPALLVVANGYRYAIPQSAVIELTRLDKANTAKQIDKIHDTYVYRLRDRLLPLLFLAAELQTDKMASQLSNNDGIDGSGTIIVLSAKDRHFAIIVDEVVDTQEIVVRPLGKQLKGLSIYAGATILGDGRVALILDVPGVAQHSGVTSTVCERLPPAEVSSPDAIRMARTRLLVLDTEAQRMALPLSQITRLEEFSRSAVETIRNQEVVRYRDDVLPLFLLSDLLPKQGTKRGSASGTTNDDEKICVIVCEKEGAAVGLVIGRVLDIEEDIQAPSNALSRDGMSSPVIAQGQVTTILDLDEILERITWGRPPKPLAQEAGVQI
jgi:two-component system, chemotaxis family, sensor kinase CheA